MTVRREPLDLLTSSKPRARQAEDTDAGVDQRIALGRPPADRIVFGEHNPTSGTRVAEPDLIDKPLRGLLAVDRRHRMDGQAAATQALGDALSEAAINEEFGRVSHRARLSNDAVEPGTVYADARVATRMTSSSSAVGTSKSSAISVMLSPD